MKRPANCSATLRLVFTTALLPFLKMMKAVVVLSKHLIYVCLIDLASVFGKVIMTLTQAFTASFLKTQFSTSFGLPLHGGSSLLVQEMLIPCRVSPMHQ